MRSFTFPAAFAIAVGCAFNAASQTPEADYPAGYRLWQHTKSMIIEPDHPLADPFAGIHHIYANPEAMRGLDTGTFTDGAVFVFDLLSYEVGDAVVVESDRKRLDVMQYDRKRFAATGGWGFSTFIGDSRTRRIKQDVTTACFGCHASAAESNHVFSRYRP